LKIKSSQCDFIVDNNSGSIMQVIWKLNRCLVSHKFLSEITSFDVKKFISQHVDLPEELDITFIGYWKNNNEYCRSVF